MPERNIKQATLIPSAQTLPNPVGTAPGWFVQKDGHIIVTMPGVPREMFRMWEEEAVPRLLPYLGASTLFTRLLRVSGIGEGAVEESLSDLLHNNNPTIATYAKPDAVDVRVSAKASTRAEAEALVSATEEKIRAILGRHIFGTDKETLASVVGQQLVARGQTLAVLESLTGGLLASMITDVPGSSQYFLGGVVTYTNAVKVQMGVPQEVIDQHGVISAETARAMAEAARRHFGSTYGIGVTGVAGPDLQEGKPVGTIYIALATPDRIIERHGPGWRGGRADQKRLAVLTALNMLRLELTK